MFHILHSTCFVSNTYFPRRVDSKPNRLTLSLHMGNDFEGVMAAFGNLESAAFPSMSEGSSIRILNEIPDAEETLLLLVNRHAQYLLQLVLCRAAT